MRYKKGLFYIENISANKIAEKFKTPVYVYSKSKLDQNIFKFKEEFKSIDPLICFSVKSNSNIEILRNIRVSGLGADVVSIGEMLAAFKAGIKKEKIVFSGVGKTEEELRFAIEKKILLINTESEQEIKEIEKLAKILKKKVNIGVRLNPDTDPKTLSKISTGKKDDKFGLEEKQILKLLKKYNKSKFINIICLSVHIGSQISSHRPYVKMLRALNKLIKKSRYNFNYIDLGGGMGIKYFEQDKYLNYKKYVYSIKKFLIGKNCKIIFEPGRSLLGNVGCIISKVIYIKETSKKKFVIIDAAMNDMIRPALYGAKHNIIASKKVRNKIKKHHEFVGPICETSDKFLNVKSFQRLKRNDYIIICDVGAYGMVLSSNYNMRPKVPEILINNSQTKLIKRRQKIKEII